MPSAFDRVLLGGQPERVPAHRVQDVEPLHALVPRHDVRRGVPLRVPDVQPRAAGIGEHVEHVELRARRVEIRVARIRCMERFLLSPDRLPARLDLVKGVGLTLLVHIDKVVGGG